MDLPFTTLDVFTSTRLAGNPLAVVQVPLALRSRLTQEAKQKIAREFNLSETVFLHEGATTTVEDPNPNPASRDIDIFTVDREVPFAGHPTIGTAVLLRDHLSPARGGDGSGNGENARVKTLRTKAGDISLEPLTLSSTSPSGDDDQGGIRAKIPHNVHLHAKTLSDILGSISSSSQQQQRPPLPGLSTDPQTLAAELDAPVFSIVNGMTFLLIGLPSLAALALVDAGAGAPDFERGLPGGPLLDAGWRDSLVCRYYYVDIGVDGAAGGGDGDGDGIRCLRTRMVEFGIEDPATGSAASALAAYLTLTEKEKGQRRRRRFRMTQGVEMGRTSVISVETTTTTKAKVGGGDGGGDDVVLEDVWLGGTAVVVMKGSLRVDV